MCDSVNHTRRDNKHTKGDRAKDIKILKIYKQTQFYYYTLCCSSVEVSL